MNKKINVAIIDDHRLFSDGLQSILEKAAIYNVSSFNNSDDRMLSDIIMLMPDIVITDFNMPVNSGIQVIRKMKNHKSHARFIVVSVREDPYAIRQAMRAGAKAYLFKNVDKEDFLNAVMEVANGSKIFPPVSAEPQHESSSNIRISVREKDVLELLCLGRSIKEVADDLYISEYTVVSHKKNLFAKTKTNSIVMLTNYAIQNGLV